MSYTHWDTTPPLAKEGVLVGSDISQEWLLAWWWEHYTKTNSHPVTFIDLGMSQEKRAWCSERGHVITLPVAHSYVKEREEIAPELIAEWEDSFGRDFWQNRFGWFKKPLACLLTPYEKTLWIDLDCEVLGPLHELFRLRPIALHRESYQSYNSGVIVFHRGMPLIETWAEGVYRFNHICAGDQDVLSKIIFEENHPVTELPPLYNWSRRNDPNPDAIILHWPGRHGKTVIAHQIARQNLMELT